VISFHDVIKKVDTIDEANKGDKDHQILGDVSHQFCAEQPLTPDMQFEVGVAISAVNFLGPQHVSCDAVGMDFLPIAVANPD
jgi:hypothetical protein